MFSCICGLYSLETIVSSFTAVSLCIPTEDICPKVLNSYLCSVELIWLDTSGDVWSTEPTVCWS